MQQDPVQKTALSFTRWVGSVPSLILHTVFFAGAFVAVWAKVIDFNQMLLILTTIVSLEAIYLAIFIQMTINYTTQSLQEVSADVEEIQEDIEEITEDVGEIQEDVEDISEDVEELQENVEEMSEDVEEMSEEDAKKLRNHEMRSATLAAIQSDLRKLMADIDELKREE
ncbi:MAG: hypothetical protein RLZZ342_104 [Candidatus Parcubacteria bacterium]|jgi:uncharacterized protein YoxC